MEYPKLSIIYPVYNEFKRGNVVFLESLQSIFSQDYPKNKFEVLLIDGGSEDDTLKTALNFNVKIIKNPFRVEEKGRPLGVKKAKGEIIVFIDSDNILVDNQFFKKMVEPFLDKEIAATQTYFFDFRKSDSFITKYCALLSGDDPIAIYLGLNDRFCFFNGKWTGFEQKKEKVGNYFKVELFKNKIPAMGSNGFFVRKSVCDKLNIDPFIHTDFVYEMVEKGYNKFGLVNVGLIHYMSGVKVFFKKKIRRMKRRFSGELSWKYNYSIKPIKVLFVSLYILILIPVIYDSIRGFIRKPSIAWLFHPIACYGVLFLYIYYFIYGNVRGFFK